MIIRNSKKISQNHFIALKVLHSKMQDLRLSQQAQTYECKRVALILWLFSISISSSPYPNTITIRITITITNPYPYPDLNPTNPLHWILALLVRGLSWL